MGISVVLLAYKEEENLRILIPKIHKALAEIGEEYDISVIDVAAPLDNTRGCCEENGAMYYNQKQPGFGGAYRRGIEIIRYEKALFIDSDGSHDPKYIKGVYDTFMSGRYDVVIGSRYIKGGKTNDSKLSVLMSRCLNTVYGICLGLKGQDLSTNFRMYHTEQLRKTDTVCVNYDVLEEILVKIMINEGRIRIGESPIEFNKRIHGESKRKLLPFIKSYLLTLFRLMKLKHDAKTHTGKK